MRHAALLLLTLLPAVAGCAGRESGTPWVGVLGEPRPISPARVRIECERMVSGEPKVTLRNLTSRQMEVELRGLAYAGRTSVRDGNGWSPVGIWEPWWTQAWVRLAAHGTWSARIYEVRQEKIEARDPRGRLLASFNLKERLPEPDWGTTVVVHSRGEWRPFGVARASSWQVIRPSEMWTDLTGYFPFPIRIIADARVEEFTRAQLDALREMVESGRTLILCGGADLSRLRRWDRAGLLAHPVRGVRSLPGLPQLARFYETPPITGPIAVADLGRVSPPARILLEEEGVPLVVERHQGLGRVLLVTFDPTRPPFRGSRLEKAFWRAWESPPDDGFRHVLFDTETAPAYRRARRRLGLTEPSVGIVAGLWLAYLVGLGMALVFSRRRLRALILASLIGSGVALILAPLLRSPSPVAAYAGVLSLRSGDARGRWWGQVELMMPTSSAPVLRVPGGRLAMWRLAPCLQSPSSPHLTVQPAMRRWMPRGGTVQAVRHMSGSIWFQVTLQDDQVLAEVRNQTPYQLQDAAVLWGRAACARLGALPPGGEARCRLASIDAYGGIVGSRQPPPGSYGDLSSVSNSPLNHLQPVLLANCPEVPMPVLLADERPVRAAGHTVLLVAADGIRLRGASRLPSMAVTIQPIRLSGARRWRSLIGMPGGGLFVEPGARQRLPPGWSSG